MLHYALSDDLSDNTATRTHLLNTVHLMQALSAFDRFSLTVSNLLYFIFTRASSLSSSWSVSFVLVLWYPLFPLSTVWFMGTLFFYQGWNCANKLHFWSIYLWISDARAVAFKHFSLALHLLCHQMYLRGLWLSFATCFHQIQFE